MFVIETTIILTIKNNVSWQDSFLFLV